MSKEMGYQPEDDMDEDILISALESVSRGGPTMPQIRYNGTKFIPTMRKHRASSNTNWDAKIVLLRCRGTESHALERYSSFIASSKKKEQLGAIAQRRDPIRITTKWNDLPMKRC